MGLRMFRDFARLQRWEREILKREDRSEGLLTRTLRAVPWTGVASMFFIMLFFGVDLGAGAKNTARQIREKKVEATEQLKQVQARQWSLEQVRNFRDGKEVSSEMSDSNPMKQALDQEAKARAK